MNVDLDATLASLQAAIVKAKDNQEVINITDRMLRLMEIESNCCWSVERTAAFLGVKPNTIRHWVCKEKIPHIKIQGTVRFNPEELKRFLIEKTRKVNKCWR